MHANSKTRDPSKPGSIKPAVRCIIKPNLPKLDLPDNVDFKLYGIFKYSLQCPKYKTPGCNS